MKEIKAFMLTISMLTLLNAGTAEQETSRAILKNAELYNIDPKILYTLISIESAFQPNIIAVETSKAAAEKLKALKSDDISIMIGRTYHSRLYLVSISPKKKEDALLIAELLKKMGFIFDVGLMQINTCNFRREETRKMFDIAYNIHKGTKILKGCVNLFRDFKNQVECYNRGAGNLRKALKKGRGYAPYYDRFIQKWEF